MAADSLVPHICDAPISLLLGPVCRSRWDPVCIRLDPVRIRVRVRVHVCECHAELATPRTQRRDMGAATA